MTLTSVIWNVWKAQRYSIMLLVATGLTIAGLLLPWFLFAYPNPQLDDNLSPSLFLAAFFDISLSSALLLTGLLFVIGVAYVAIVGWSAFLAILRTVAQAHVIHVWAQLIIVIDSGVIACMLFLRGFDDADVRAPHQKLGLGLVCSVVSLFIALIVRRSIDGKPRRKDSGRWFWGVDEMPEPPKPVRRL